MSQRVKLQPISPAKGRRNSTAQGRRNSTANPLSPPGRGRRNSAVEIDRRQAYKKKTETRKKAEKKAVAYLEKEDKKRYGGRRGSTGSMPSPTKKDRRSSLAERHKHMQVLQDGNINYSHAEKIRKVQRRASAFEATSKIQSSNTMKKKTSKKTGKQGGQEYMKMKKKEALDSLARKERERGVQKGLVGGGLPMPSILLDTNNAPELLDKQVKKKQREEEEKLKQDTAMNVQWDKTAQRWVETEEEVGEKSCFNCCSRSTKQKPKKKKGESMKEKAQDKGLKCMFALPGCIKRAIKKTCLCFAGTIQCILCAPKLAEGMEMQTQVNPEN